MGLGIGRKLKKAARKVLRGGLGGSVWGKIAEKTGIGVDPKTGKISAKHFLDPAGIFTGDADAFHQKLGIGVRPPKIGGMGTDPEGERIAAETQAAQQAAMMSTMKRRLRRVSMLSAGGSVNNRPMLYRGAQTQTRPQQNGGRISIRSASGPIDKRPRMPSVLAAAKQQMGE